MPDTDDVPNGGQHAEGIKDALAQFGLLSDLLADPEVKASLLVEIRELGVPAPLHHVVLRLIIAAAGKSEKFLGEAIASRLKAFIDRTPALAGLLQRLINIRHGEQTKDTLKHKALEAIRNGNPIKIDEIKTDETTSLEVLLALHNIRGFDQVLTGLDQHTTTLINTLRADIRNLFQDIVAPSLSWPTEEHSPDTLGAFDRVKYTSGLDELYGRKAEISLLHQFAGDLSLCGRIFNFRWMLLTGDGGTGKTRLAYDFTRKHLHPNVWDAGRLLVKDLQDFNNLEKWRPRQPTFIVIDYVSGQPEKTGDLMRIFARQAAQYDFPVRLLLLERNAGENWLAKMLPEDGDKPMVMDHIFGHKDEKGRIIPPVTENAIIDLMRARFTNVEHPPPHDKILLGAAKRVDPRQNGAAPPRPLFALATAESMIATAPRPAPADFSQIAADLNQEDVLQGMLQREEKKRWCITAPNDDDRTLRRYKVALALATLSQGLDLFDLETKDDDYGPLARYLPDPPPDHHSGLINALGGTGTFLPPLEPDIMGEFFLAQCLLKDFPKPKDRHAFLNGALAKRANDNIAPLITLLRLLQDFPQKTAEIDIPAAMTACTNETAALSYARMAPDWIFMCYRVNTPDAATDFIDALSGLGTRFPKNAEIALAQAEAAVNITNHAGENGDWDRVDDMLARLDALGTRFPNNREIALEQAKAAVNITSDAGEIGDWDRVDDMLARLDALGTRFPDHAEIALMQAKAAVNITNHAGGIGDWGRVDDMLARLDALGTRFPDHAEIALMQANAAVNITINAGKDGELDRVEAMHQRLEILAEKFGGDMILVEMNRQSFTLDHAVAYADAILRNES
ncbi:hypothetical protein [Thalassospira sp.]|uniref:hypothetical protein n=1 Tax=Thalassospira sp. TaxID=1912094 RepID=UPI0027355A1B|nr:hypothetical protein [Thalassospira sp.]MDP2698766.1 hypothetical protein [Thalassospira sp.]